jgi:hypothetical protein
VLFVLKFYQSNRKDNLFLAAAMIRSIFILLVLNNLSKPIKHVHYVGHDKTYISVMKKKLFLLFFLTSVIEFIYAAESNLGLRLHKAAAYNDIDTLMQAFRDNWNLNKQENNGATPLHYNAKLGNNTFPAQLLVEHRANTDIVDNYGNRPVDIAAQRKKHGLTALFMQYSDPETPLSNGTSLFKSALTRLKYSDESDYLEALMKNHRFNKELYIQKAIESANFKAANFMKQWLNQQRQPNHALARAQLKRKADDPENQPAAKRQRIGDTEESEICFSCQEPLCPIKNPGTFAFTCGHQVHANCLSDLVKFGYSKCQICQAALKDAKGLPAGPSRTAAELDQEAWDEMIANLLAAGVIDQNQLPYVS